MDRQSQLPRKALLNFPCYLQTLPGPLQPCWPRLELLRPVLEPAACLSSDMPRATAPGRGETRLWPSSALGCLFRSWPVDFHFCPADLTGSSTEVTSRGCLLSMSTSLLWQASHKFSSATVICLALWMVMVWALESDGRGFEAWVSHTLLWDLE